METNAYIIIGISMCHRKAIKVHNSIIYRKNRVLRRFQQLRSYRDDIETRNREEIPYSSRMVTRGVSSFTNSYNNTYFLIFFYKQIENQSLVNRSIS